VATLELMEYDSCTTTEDSLRNRMDPSDPLELAAYFSRVTTEITIN
jgi:hypothetical protein